MEVKKVIRILRLSKKRCVWVTRLVQRPPKPVYIKSSKSSAEKGVLSCNIANVNADFTILDERADKYGSAFEGCPNRFENPYR